MRKAMTPDMFHDEAAHELEGRFAILAAVAAVILALYGIFYHLAV